MHPKGVMSMSATDSARMNERRAFDEVNASEILTRYSLKNQTELTLSLP
jgi:hypothetical protein